jgi:hypothetical protein
MSKMDRWRGNADEARQLARARMLELAKSRGRRRPSRAGAILAAIGGAVAGAAATFFMDPTRGRSRRARYLDQGAAAARALLRSASRRGRRLRGDAMGMREKLAHAGNGQPMPGDATLVDRVESELFADQRIPKGKININVEEGVVVLRGEVDNPGEADELVRKAQRIPGVARVDSLLHLPGEPAPAEPPREHSRVTTVGPEGHLPG